MNFFVDQDTLLAYLDLKDIYVELKKFSDQMHAKLNGHKRIKNTKEVQWEKSHLVRTKPIGRMSR